MRRTLEGQRAVVVAAAVAAVTIPAHGENSFVKVTMPVTGSGRIPDTGGSPATELVLGLVAMAAGATLFGVRRWTRGTLAS